MSRRNAVCLHNGQQERISSMKAQEKFSSLRAAALLTATSTNLPDFEDSKQSLLKELGEELRKGGDRQFLYQQVIKGLLLEGLDDKNVDQVLSEFYISQHAASVREKLERLYCWLKWALIPGVLLSLGVGVLVGVGLIALL